MRLQLAVVICSWICGLCPAEGKTMLQREMHVWKMKPFLVAGCRNGRREGKAEDFAFNKNIFQKTMKNIFLSWPNIWKRDEICEIMNLCSQNVVGANWIWGIFWGANPQEFSSDMKAC